MLILSIDVGIKNLAVCICDISKCDISQNYEIKYWDVINLCGEENYKCSFCENNAKFTKNNTFYCNKHTKNSTYLKPKFNICNIDKLKKDKLVSHCNTHDICCNMFNKLTKDNMKTALIEKYTNNYLDYIEKINAGDFSLIDLGRNLNNNFNKLLSEKKITSENLKYVIIENQISPIANRMKSIQCMIAQYFITKNIENILFISASNKLNQFMHKVTEYKERKKMSIEITKKILEENKLISNLNYFNKHKKKDDLADAFLQLLWFKNNMK